MTETQTRAQAIETLALAYHKEQEGEYGCPGVQCPAVKKLTAFGLSCADEANRDLLAQLAQEQHARQEVERKLESAYKTVEALDDAGIEAVRVVRAEAESHLSSLQEEIARLKEFVSCVRDWFKAMDAEDEPYDVKSGTPLDIQGHIQRVERLRNKVKDQLKMLEDTRVDGQTVNPPERSTASSD